MMKLPARLTLILLCALMIVALPFFVPSPRMTQEAETVYFEEEEGEDEAENEIDFESLLFSAARAEDAPDDLIVEETDGSGLMVSPEWELPIDFSVPPAPNPAHFTENGYEDESVRVTVETRQEEGVTWYIAYIQIASPTQLRTAVSQKGAKVSNMAEKK